MLKQGVWVLLVVSSSIQAEVVGSVRTLFNLVGANDKIIVEVFDDPSVAGISCYLSRTVKGGLSDSMGLAEDPVDATISCQQTAVIVLPDAIRQGKREGELVFQSATSPWFKVVQVLRFYDAKRNTLVYLSYNNKLVNGSLRHNVSAVPILPVTPVP